MKRLWLLQLFLVLSEVSSKGVRKDKEKNPDVLKEFRSFADSVIPEEKSASRKISGKPHLSLVKDPAVYIDEPLRQVTRKVTFASTGHNTNDEVAKTVYPNGPSTQRDDTYKKQEGDDDEVDTYIDEKEEYKSDEKGSLAKKKHPARTKAEPSVQTAVNHGQPAVAITGRGQVQNESKPAEKAPKERKPSIAKIIRQVTRVKGGDPPTFDELIRILHAAGISDKDLADIEKAAPWNCEDIQCGTKDEVGKLGEKKKAYRHDLPAVNVSAPPTNDLQQCISTCPATCAPECTPQCCTQETAPPPVKKVHTPPTEEKPIRWFERPRYEPGPNIPPPIFPTGSCDVTCTRSCTPSCKQHGCCKVKTAVPIIGCSEQCTPNICSVGCPAHCCARYITSVDPARKNISI